MSKEKTTYRFDTLTLTFEGLGLPYLSDKAKEIIANMSKENATAVNKSAWKQRNSAVKVCNRHCNFSTPGNMRIYDQAYHTICVAELVCKATYRVMVSR